MNISSHPLRVLLVTLHVSCTPPLTALEQESIAHDAVLVGVCQSKGRECKRTDGGDCFGVYDDCILDAGLREGSAK